MRPFPSSFRVRWRRIDVPGREEAQVEQTATGWRLTGELDVAEADVAARLRYVIECDEEWRTRTALIEGEANGGPVRFALEADGEGHWTRDNTPVPHLDGALDVDLGFTPATNTLPIRRLALAVGDTGPVRSAWLRFPELRLEPLEQTYTREAERIFHYRALVDGEPFVARLDTDDFGRVLHYEGLWQAEPSDVRSLVEAFYADVWNRHDQNAASILLADDFSFRGSLGTEHRGHQSFLAYVDSIHHALDGYRCEILDLLVDGDRAFARMRFSGVHVGELLGQAPTRRRVSWDGAALFDAADGRLTSVWVLGDLHGLLHQLGR